MSESDKVVDRAASEAPVTDPATDDTLMPQLFDNMWRKAFHGLATLRKPDVNEAAEIPASQLPALESEIAGSGLRLNLDAREIANLSSSLGQTYERFAATKLELEARVRERTRGLDESRKRLELVIDSISDALIGFNGNGEIDSINRAAESLFGYAQQDVAQQLVTMLIPALQIENDPSGEAVVFTALRADGQKFQVEGSIRSMQLDNQVHYVAALRDLTKQKYTQKRLNEQAFLIERSKSFVLTMNADLEIQWCNPCFEELTGYSLTELFGQSLHQRLLSPDTPEKTLLDIEEARKEHLPHSGDLILMHRTNRPFWVHFEAHPIFDDEGQFEKYAAIGVDITWRKQHEQQQVDFVSMVSHELRTPLTAVSGSLDALEMSFSGDLPEMAKSFVEMGQRNCAHLSRLIEDLLDINKLEAGIIRFQSQSVSLTEVVMDAVRTINPMAEKNGITVVTALDADEPNVFVDPQRLKQVALNLLSNSVKFSHKGGEIIVSTKKHGNAAVLQVEDHGLGMSAEFQRRVFERFARDPEVQAHGIEGFGLGLSISKGLIEQMDGKISFDSVPGEGTTFRVELPTTHASVVEAKNEQR